MPTKDSIFPSKYLKAADVDPPVVAIVDRCPIETVGHGAKAEQKVVVYLRGGGLKPYPCNTLNWDTLVELSGAADSDEWAGTAVELFAVDVLGPNGPTRGVRMRRPQRRPATPPRATTAAHKPAAAAPTPTARQARVAVTPSVDPDAPDAETPPDWNDDDIEAAFPAPEAE